MDDSTAAVRFHPIDVFLREHAFVHTEAVAKARSVNVDVFLKGLTDSQLRIRPHGLNSIAWLFWHVARVEDAFISGLVMQRPQLLDQGGWDARLNAGQRGFGTGMSREEVAELSDRIDLQALWAYRDEVGRRTRTMVRELSDHDWAGAIETAHIDQAAAAGIFTAEFVDRLKGFLPGRTRESALYWWGLDHTLIHIGQVMMLLGPVKALAPA
jgi:DinB family protein